MGERGRTGLLLFTLVLSGSIVAAAPTPVQARKHRLHRGCGFGIEFPSKGPTAETGALDPTVTSMFAVLRRPAGPSDQVPPINPLGEDLRFQLRSYFPAYIRQIASDPEGEQYFLIAGFERTFPVPAARCLPTQVRRHRAQLVAEQRKRESQPVYCIEDIGPHRPSYGGASCEPFAAIQTGGGLVARAASKTDVVELVPDGVATVRLRYSSGTVITASVANNGFDFTPNPRMIKEAFARIRRLGQALSRRHFTPRNRSRAERLFLKLVADTANGLAPATVEWLGGSGQPIRSFRPTRSERGGLFGDLGSVGAEEVIPTR